MRSGDVEVRRNRRGIAQLLTSPEVHRDLVRRAQRIASRANQGISDEGFVVDSQTTGERARAAVIARSFPARIAESEHRQLSRSLDAGR